MSSTTFPLDPLAPSAARSSVFVLSRQTLFRFLLVWYWLLLYFQSHNAVVERFSLLYFALTLPILAFVVFNLHHIMSWRYDRITAPLALYIGLVGAVSVLRSDLATAYNVVLFTAPVMLILRHRLQVPIGLLNRLFLLSIAGAVLTYSLGISEFGYLPGQSEMSADRGLQWRVSLFPVLPESAFFSLLVLFANLLYSRGRTRWFFCSFAAYFLLLSGNRTSLIVALVSVVVLVFTRRVEFRPRPFYKLLFVGLAASFILLVSMDAILTAIAIDNPVLANYLFRAQEGQAVVDSEEVVRTVYRTWLWQQHLQIFSTSPLTGVGTFFLPDLLTERLLKSNIDTGSESLLTGLLARVGLMIVPLLVFFGRLLAWTMEQRDRLGYCLCLSLFVFSLAYGSFLVPYNFIFLLTFAALNGLANVSETPAA